MDVEKNSHIKHSQFSFVTENSLNQSDNKDLCKPVLTVKSISAELLSGGKEDGSNTTFKSLSHSFFFPIEQRIKKKEGYCEIGGIEVALVSNYAKSRRSEKKDSRHGFPNGAGESDRKVSRRENWVYAKLTSARSRRGIASGCTGVTEAERNRATGFTYTRATERDGWERERKRGKKEDCGLNFRSKSHNRPVYFPATRPSVLRACSLYPLRLLSLTLHRASVRRDETGRLYVAFGVIPLSQRETRNPRSLSLQFYSFAVAIGGGRMEENPKRPHLRRKVTVSRKQLRPTYRPKVTIRDFKHIDWNLFFFLFFRNGNVLWDQSINFRIEKESIWF